MEGDTRAGRAANALKFKCRRASWRRATKESTGDGRTDGRSPPA
jgi:hypothetical protein